ncbi:hypothetical protein GCM10009733_076300 [Nonomuraea maheshkhaliensis]|uniref:Uncharacterized protein n=1 Tax=Nonomuraea maheshkhaliensis TaxID=419590 RepID=A0ABN2GA03_9ACTN
MRRGHPFDVDERRRGAVGEAVHHLQVRPVDGLEPEVRLVAVLVVQDQPAMITGRTSVTRVVSSVIRARMDHGARVTRAAVRDPKPATRRSRPVMTVPRCPAPDGHPAQRPPLPVLQAHPIPGALPLTSGNKPAAG